MAAVTPEIVGRNFEVTPDIREMVESKLGRVEDRLFDDVISVRVMLEVEKYRVGPGGEGPLVPGDRVAWHEERRSHPLQH